MSSDSAQDNILEPSATEPSVTEESVAEEHLTEQVVSESVADTAATDDAALSDSLEPESPEAGAPIFAAAPLDEQKIQNILEAALMAAGQPLSIDRMLTLFMDVNQPSRDEIRAALETLSEACENRGVELVEVGSGFRYQARQDNAEWVARLWEEKPARYSRALLETLALIAYRQPITRGEIEDIRGVSVSTNIMKTLMERDWVKVVGHRDVPGKPAMYASTKQFLDYFSLKNLSDLPSLAEIRDIDSINAELDLAEPDADKKDTDAEADAQLDLAANDINDGDDVAVTDTLADEESVEIIAEQLSAESLDTEFSTAELSVTDESTTSAVDPA